MSIELRPITEDEFDAFHATVETTFGEVVTEEAAADARLELEMDRTLAAFDGSRIVGTAAALTFELTLPGGMATPAGGVTWVSVASTHRRRGILTSMMARQLEDVRARGEPVAILLSSESVIYGRFGYGTATHQVSLEVSKHYRAFGRHPQITGTVDVLTNEQRKAVLPGIYDRARALYPGCVDRNESWWGLTFKDRERWRDGHSDRRSAVYTSGSGSVDGYASYRTKGHWENGLSAGTVAITDFITVTSEARAALFQFCTSMDLFDTVKIRNAPVDDPLRWMMADPRRLRVTNYGDFLWLRPVDIPQALAARRYSTEDRLIFEIHDPFIERNSGRYALEAGPDGATCERVRSDADITLQVSDLGAAYLGGVTFTTLAQAGRVTGQTRDCLRRADLMFSSVPSPWAATGF